MPPVGDIVAHCCVRTLRPDEIAAYDGPYPDESYKDPISGAARKVFQDAIPGAVGQPHAVIPGAGHNLQEDCGPELGAMIADFVTKSVPT